MIGTGFHGQSGRSRVAASETVDIAIVGAGVVGLATALRLVADGREVLLIDPNEPGSGASSGNAGTIAE